MEIASVRGAITIEENTKEQIVDNTRVLLEEMIKRNHIDLSQIISILFTATGEITAAYPAVAARNMGLTNISLMCMQEMYVDDGLEWCIRVMMMLSTDSKTFKPKHVYLKDAVSLRPDLTSKKFSIAIDGPSGVGKSSLAKLLAKELEYIYIDTGAMYRAFALYCLRNSITPLQATKEYIEIEIRHASGEQRVLLNREDVTKKIRTQEIAAAASEAAAIYEVREKLVELQQKLAASKNVIMDGRDIGTVVLPNADVKIYLDASSIKRAERRCAELDSLSTPYDFETIKKEIEERDFNDMNRQFSPLKKADDAVVVDTSDMTLEEVKSFVLDIINKGR